MKNLTAACARRPNRSAMSTRSIVPTGTVSLVLALFCLVGTPCRGDWEDEPIIPMLKTKTGVYTNVTITSRTAKELCILHAGGIGNVYLEDLTPEAQVLVGYAPPVPAGEAIQALANEQFAALMEVVPFELDTTGTGAGTDGVTTIRLSPAMIVMLVGLSFIGYLLYSCCLMLICRKAGEKPGLLVWVPLLQVFPMLRAAGMSGWWVLGMLVPLLNLVVWILWCFNIVGARGKSAVWAVLLILPFTNLIAFLYLAFSSDDSHDSEDSPHLPALAIRAV
jgi:hypothetical protein